MQAAHHYDTSIDLRTRYTGKERDTESGLDYFGARYYASSTGRWSSPDYSDIPEPVPYASLSDPQSLNLYSYVGNNPLTQSDADGHCYKADNSTAWFCIKTFLKNLWDGSGTVGGGNNNGPADSWPNDFGRQVSVDLGRRAKADKQLIGIQAAIAGLELAPIVLTEAAGAGTTLEMTMVNGSEIETAAADAESPFNQYLSKGARALDKRLGEANSPFTRGQNPGQVARDIMSKANKIFRGARTTDTYDATGIGVRIDSATHKFITFITRAAASR